MKVRTFEIPHQQRAYVELLEALGVTRTPYTVKFAIGPPYLQGDEPAMWAEVRWDLEVSHVSREAPDIVEAVARRRAVRDTPQA